MAEKHENGGVFSKVGGVNRLSHPNFVWGPLLTTLENLISIAAESVMFCEVSERKQPIYKKVGG